jgi:hypothetical protein
MQQGDRLAQAVQLYATLDALVQVRIDVRSFGRCGLLVQVG